MSFHLANIPEPIVILIIGVVAFAFALWVRRLIHRYVTSSSMLLKVDPTRYSFLKNASTFIIFSLAVFLIIYSVPELGSLGATLFASAGVVAAVLAFASQQAMSNIISGIFIVIFKPFRVGDIIETDAGRSGVVEDITLRHTIIKDFQNQRIIIPNTVISSQTIINANISDERIKRQMFFSISYDSNIDLAFRIIVDEAMKHPMFLDNRSVEEIQEGYPKVKCRVVGFLDSGVKLRADVWAASPGDAFELRCDLNKSVKERFDREGIEIPFPYRTIVYKNDLRPNVKQTEE
ncbi:MAG: mechanosensitive ion channel family protein [Flavobacteriales bacterium]|nr:mechanosensitive ion channel family protein [Flavobacteriales bacterium]